MDLSLPPLLLQNLRTCDAIWKSFMANRDILKVSGDIKDMLDEKSTMTSKTCLWPGRHITIQKTGQWVSSSFSSQKKLFASLWNKQKYLYCNVWDQCPCWTIVNVATVRSYLLTGDRTRVTCKFSFARNDIHWRNRTINIRNTTIDQIPSTGGTPPSTKYTVPSTGGTPPSTKDTEQSTEGTPPSAKEALPSVLRTESSISENSLRLPREHDVNLNSEISLRQTVIQTSISGTRGFVKYSCNDANKCKRNRCKCFRARLFCNSLCHSSLSCSSK